MAHRSRWGWHPCDYATYRLLKDLNALHEQARRQFAAWQRWRRKLPHNRVLRRKVVAQGNQVGTEVVGPRPEPPLHPLFRMCRQVLSYHDAGGRPLRKPQHVEEVVFLGHGIPEAYRLARTPVATPQQVEPLPLTTDEIRHLAEEAARLGQRR